MSERERDWMVELRRVLEVKEALKDAQAKLGGSYRNAKRKLKRLREEGDEGLVHRSRGRPSNRAKPGRMNRCATAGPGWCASAARARRRCAWEGQAATGR